MLGLTALFIGCVIYHCMDLLQDRKFKSQIITKLVDLLALVMEQTSAESRGVDRGCELDCGVLARRFTMFVNSRCGADTKFELFSKRYCP